MTGRKPGLPMTRHEEIGLELARTRDRLAVLGAEIANAYPKNGRAGRLALAAAEPLDRLRCELEDRMFAEHPGEDRATTHVYYPSPEARRSP